MKVALIAAVLAAFAFGFGIAQQSALLEPLNTGVNSLLEAAGVPNRTAARVVPIVAAGGGTRGYAQIVGPENAVRQTKAIVALQAQGGTANITALIPVTSVDRKSGAMKRANGVAVDAVIDTHF
jgi:spore maturation protein SpmB